MHYLFCFALLYNYLKIVALCSNFLIIYILHLQKTQCSIINELEIEKEISRLLGSAAKTKNQKYNSHS